MTQEYGHGIVQIVPHVPPSSPDRLSNVSWAGNTIVGGGGGLKWSGCNVRISLWPRLPHGCHRHEVRRFDSTICDHKFNPRPCFR